MPWPIIASHSPTGRSQSLKNLRVLVIENESDSRELIAEVLQASGADVVSLGSGIEALAEMERQPFDVLISDIGMPLMDGKQSRRLQS